MNIQLQTLPRPHRLPQQPPHARKIEGLPLTKPGPNDSYHSSVMPSQRNSSMNNIVNSSCFNTQNSFSRVSGMGRSLSSSRVLPGVGDRKGAWKSTWQAVDRQMSGKLKTDRSASTQRESPNKISRVNEQEAGTVEDLLKKYIDTNFIQSLMEFINKEWSEHEAQMLRDKRFEALKNAIIQKTNQLNSLAEEYMTLHYGLYTAGERKLMVSLLLKLQGQVLKQYQDLFIEVLKRVPEDKVVRQEAQLEEVYAMLMDIFDPRYINSVEKMKERNQLFMEGYTASKNSLTATIATKLKPQIDFVSEIERYLQAYQKEIFRVRHQLQAAEMEKAKLSELLRKKVNFTPIELDFDRLKAMKDESKKEFFEDLEGNYVKFHKEQHRKNDRTIKSLQSDNQKLKAEIQKLNTVIESLKKNLEVIKNSQPRTEDAAVQVHYFNSLKSFEAETLTSRNLIFFLQNVSTPFSFNQKIAGSLINILAVDKILYDYEIIKAKGQLQSFSDFMIGWFLVRTGCKKIAQIFAKNFMYSVKEYKNRHKRFNMFGKICGFNGFRKKNLQQDLEYIFFQTQRAWYYIIKLAMLYRKKLNENPTGFHLFPPIQCESIFKLPLRKIYELVEQFLKAEGVEVPADLNTQIDYYAINEVSRYRSHDEEFQNGQLQEIHILREINFDIIAGFIVEYIAREKCVVLQKFIRALTLKQRETGNVLGYSEFEALYRKFYKERRAKIEQVYSKMCVINQHDMLDIENAEPIIRAIIEDESGLRNSFQEIQSLRALVHSEKTNLRGEKLTPNVNSYQSFRQRYYFEFYDFYNTTFFLEEIFRTIRILIKKKLKDLVRDEQQLEELVADRDVLKIQEEERAKQEGKDKDQDEQEDEDEDGYSQGLAGTQGMSVRATNNQPSHRKSDLETKVEEWNKIIVRIPHFAAKILTIDQTIVHNMRRKQMIEASEFAWRTLRDILIMLSKQ